ncbi:MAG: nuclear transport factor 2 family protein [Bacteroidetes bacterium]|nr:nuclear transport factor 2 family protein [Bacteroidota bacterium]
MKKSFILIILLFAVSISSYCQSGQDKEVSAAVEKLMKGIVDADKGLLQDITAEELVYGHSSGKVQNRTEFIEEVLVSKPIDFIKIDLAEQTIKVIGDAAVVRHILSAEITNNGTPGNLRIGNMLVWQKQKGKWKLIARQAYKL